MPLKPPAIRDEPQNNRFVMAVAGGRQGITIFRYRGATRFGDRLGFITIHPSFLLRLPQEEERMQAFDTFVTDLRQIRRLSAA